MAETAPLRIGVLALQGAFAEHIQVLRRLGAEAVEVRKAEQLAQLDGLIIPGGESTTIGLIAARWGLVEPLRRWVQTGRPIWGTCAGMILLAEQATGQKAGGQPLLGGLRVTVNRNFFGRQTESFETLLHVPALGPEPCPAVFIRAPAITAVEPGVEVLATLAVAPFLRPGFRRRGAGEEAAAGSEGATETAPKTEEAPAEVIVAVRQGTILATAFHPELTDDVRWHRLFLEMAAQSAANPVPANPSMAPSGQTGDGQPADP
ncbi:pyridoxal 5'-phosphate synthase glutaminase subunit PdxT [Litorilinea aerophila]|uniref:Pyridoxal 5'-phosphate synthase subunit PdxT n=1 Tax=Litorilinea aerophila TaxID=1204385 RepID=A0A540V9B5_9CHLR|nr:pyridoxal 5'-phosphate synthase glutaminase subunit PdxT [Litorilinea aerophila]MCC9078763.1 pyridoxal 5'-phosphate synthase glutaminase subunit PdxT [Litorilinea aerophila]GIV78777.1 MAG: pyridoxal 5'-phosphate synthase subunit PdxT [Litorilinea sp.]